MKAAVLKELGTAPVYEEVKEPEILADEVLMHVKAVAIKTIDKIIASGTHYASYKKVPVVVGMDGVGVLENGTLIYTQSKESLAEKASIKKDNYVALPSGIDLSIAAALPNAALGSYLPLMVKGQFEKGKTVLINGGTGITGKFAIQLAKHYGAKKIIVTGRIENRQQELFDLGADELISTEQDEAVFKKEIQRLNRENPVDIVLDYLWGRPAEIIIQTLGGDGDNHPETPVRLINLGSLSGTNINLDCNIIRSSKLEILGSGLGSYSKTEFSNFYKTTLLELFELASQGIVSVDVVVEDLKNIEQAWNRDTNGKRLVIKI